MLIVITIGMFLYQNANAQAPNWLWATMAGGGGIDIGSSIAVDSNGNSYVTGGFSSASIGFGTDTLSSAGNTDIFVVKYDASGNEVWAKSAGGTNADVGESIAVDGSGNSYVTGSFMSASITFGTTTLTNTSSGTMDIFIVKYDAAGNVLWAVKAGGTGADAGTGIAVDGNGSSYVTGNFTSSTLAFGTTTLTNAGANDIFIAKYNSSGVIQWSESAGGNYDDMCNSIAVDGIGNSYITGGSGSTSISFGSITLNITGVYDFIIAKYNGSGSAQWARNAGVADGKDVTLDGSGNCYVTGSFSTATIAFGTSTLTNAGSFTGDLFVVKYNAAGTVQWATSTGGYIQEYGYGIAVDGNGNSYITGSFSSPSVVFGSTTLTHLPGADADIFVVKYSSAGNALWATSASGGDDEYPYDIAVDGSGNSYITGYFQSGNVSFGSNTLTIVGGQDVFIAGLEEVVGINEITGNENDFILSPNPASGNFTITFSSAIKNGIIEIINVMGEKVLMEKIKNESNKEIHLINNTAGIYFVKVFDEEKNYCKKLIVDHAH